MPSLRGIFENTIAGLLVAAILVVAAWGISHIDAPLALWIVFLIVAVAVIAGFFVGRASRYGDDLLGYQSDLLAEAMLALRDVAAGKLEFTFDEFIERGVLAPARFGLTLERGEEIRLSILQLGEDGNHFRMVFESGHTLGRKENFSLPKASMAGHALETGELQWSNDVANDQRWNVHPKADQARRYQSLACMPIIVGDESVAVLNVLSSEKGAFFQSDLTYVELLGGFLGLAWALQDDAGRSHRLPKSQEPEAKDRKGT